MNSAIQGAILGVIVSLTMAIMSGFQGGLIYTAAGLIYGIIIDVVAINLPRLSYNNKSPMLLWILSRIRLCFILKLYFELIWSPSLFHFLTKLI